MASAMRGQISAPPLLPPVRNKLEADEQATRDRLTPLVDRVAHALVDIAPTVLAALNNDESMFCSMLRERLAGGGAA
jgi:hypothetical protein